MSAPWILNRRALARRAVARRAVAGVATLAVAAVGLGAGAVSVALPAGDTSPGAVRVSADDAVRWVVVVSVDGLNPDAIRQLGATGTPSLHRLMRRGAATLEARTAYERTITLPNHTTMVSGRWVTEPGGHGVTFNDDDGSTVHAHAGEYAASMFDVVHDAGRRTAMYSSKDKFKLLDRSWNAHHGAVDQVRADDGRDKIDRFSLASEATNVRRLVERLRTRPRALSFLHLAQPDRTGHEQGFMGSAYLDAVRAADAQVGRVLDAVRADERLRSGTVVVLTADHGGRGAEHSTASSRDNYTVPFMVWGAGVAAGADLYALNQGTRTHPGGDRPTYADPAPIRNGEVANLVTDLLDLRAVPGATFNPDRDLAVR